MRVSDRSIRRVSRPADSYGCTGRYFEPFYLVFSPAEASSSDSHPVNASAPLQIVHHSIPHWLPLKGLSQKYLGLGIRGDEDDDEASAEGSSSLKSKVQPDLDVSPKSQARYSPHHADLLPRLSSSLHA